MNVFRLLTIAVCAAATAPRLAHRGMFVDGVTYASIARNLAEGRGSFWTPSYTATLYPQFREHPPLGLWLQSLWFRVLGDHLFVERLYSVTVALATAWLIAMIWRQFDGGDGPADDVPDYVRTVRTGMEWLPILLWIAAPGVSWVIVGNLLETTVTLFVTAAVAASLCAALGPAPKAAIGWSVLSGLSVVAAALTKGPVGLFPLAAPIAFLFLPNRRHAWRPVMAQWMTVVACALLLLAWPAARGSLTEYMSQQVVAALAGTREVSDSSLTILKELLQGVALPIAAVAMLAVAAAGRFVPPPPAARRAAVPLLLLGLAGTLPILLSVKQAGHYLVPAVPLYALASAMVLAPTVGFVAARFGNGYGRTLILGVSAIVIAGTMGAALTPRFGRDRAWLADLDAIASEVPRDQTIGICPEANADWGLHAWFERRFRVSLDAGTGKPRATFLKTAGDGAGCPPAACASSTDPGRALVLMTCARTD